ncbi:YhcH/YjgK/YiaL family protein [Flavobacteriaceae bacterium MAR_2010_105]|nr:YhcH/YjgK/YiaL family protein [Flavobacteriaceae bacterium MAR_2010_105]
MIVEKLKNATLHLGLNERINKAISYIQTTDFSQLEVGRYDIEGKCIYALVFEYETNSINEGYLEAHKKYIDVHYIVEGGEGVGFAALDKQEAIEAYNVDDDYTLFKGDYSLISLKKGMMAIFFPDDLHKPGIKTEKFSRVKKVVVKVKV